MRFLGVAILLQICACAAPMCRLPLALDLPPPWVVNVYDLPVSTWAALLQRGATHDCTGNRLPLPEGAAKDPTVLLHTSNDGTYVVWLRTHDAGEETIFGPIARVRVDYDELRVISVGTLTLVEGETTFEERRLQNRDILLARSSNCSPLQEDRLPCRAQLAVLVEDDHHLGVLPVQVPQDTQRGQALFDLERHARDPLTASTARLFSQQTDVELRDDGAVVATEVITVEDSAPPGGGEFQRLLRRSDQERVLRLEQRVWQANAPSLWQRLRAKDGRPR